ncbi:unnamed protein product [Cylicostephanus goldi]|uniref:Sema domain-containing protein n=1 Tax=Cylicostephanus goldi TaxID=71465 RepID=A0A3P6TNU1_CYLGO|nr:unnamed protein product [Cylicostephanus goldi]
MLRKCIYSTDGDQIYITRFEKSYTSLARKFSCNGDNPFNTDKTSSLIVINELSREMLLCGSTAGIVRVSFVETSANVAHYVLLADLGSFLQHPFA